MSSVRRYNEIATMRLVLPLSTPGMRFCTSELKIDPMNSELRRRARAAGVGEVVSACGIRREKSPARHLKPVAKLDRNASSQRVALWNWHPIIDWSAVQGLDSIAQAGLDLHGAYTAHELTRVSCRFCIMSSTADLLAASRAEENSDLFRRMVALEAKSTFGFQGQRWLADVAPFLLDEAQASAVARAKEGARIRAEAEAEIPEDLLHGPGGWPRRMPSPAEADLIAVIRRRVAVAVGLGQIGFTDGSAVSNRFAELMSLARDSRPLPPSDAKAQALSIQPELF